MEKIELNKNNNFLNQIKSKVILKKILKNLEENKAFLIIRYNKSIQNKLCLNLKDYIRLSSRIEIEIYPIEQSTIFYINLKKPERGQIFRYYFNDDKNRIKDYDYFIQINNKIKKINLIIDYENIPFNGIGLFEGCRYIRKINFIKFRRKEINDMSNMFLGCTSLEEINFNNFYTDNVTNMSCMFYECKSLKKVNLSKFNTSKVMICFSNVHH